MPDVICLGEMLIDFVSTESGVTLSESPAFKKAPGGAPANVAVGLAKLGVSCGFMGKVGDDDFGRFLAHTLESNGVDTTGLDETTELFSSGVIDSVGMVQLIGFVETEGNLTFGPEEITLDHLDSIGRILKFVANRDDG